MQNLMKKHSLSNQISCFTKEKIENVFIERLSTGFKQLDEVLGGGFTEGTTVLGAVSGLGKSTFALQLAQNVAKTGKPVLFFSQEMSAVRIASKAISRQLYLNSIGKTEKVLLEADKLLSRDNVQGFDEQWKDIDAARKIVEEETKNLYIIEGGNTTCSAGQICKIVKNFIENSEEGKKPWVIVDYLQILSADNQIGRGESKYVVDASMQTLRNLSMEEKIPLLLISSLNRESYNKEIRFEGFKETGSIEYSADEVLGLQFSAVHDGKNFNLNKEKAKSPRDVEIVVLKQRYGKSGDAVVPFKYYAEYDCFIEKESERQESVGNVTVKKETEEPRRINVPWNEKPIREE